MNLHYNVINSGYWADQESITTFAERGIRESRQWSAAQDQSSLLFNSGGQGWPRNLSAISMTRDGTDEETGSEPRRLLSFLPSAPTATG
jgi:hypothetical protein